MGSLSCHGHGRDVVCEFFCTFAFLAFVYVFDTLLVRYDIYPKS